MAYIPTISFKCYTHINITMILSSISNYSNMQVSSNYLCLANKHCSTVTDHRIAHILGNS